MQDFKIRASAASKIMGAKGLGKTGESYCKEWLIESLFNRRKEFSNKFTEKGLINEDESIDFIAQNYGYGFLVKNEKSFENDFFTGTPDIILKDEVIDAKSSWDIFTIPLFNEPLNPAYFHQGQVYMKLTGRKDYKVIYVLTDTPLHLIEREARNYCFKNGFDELDMDTFKEFEKRMTYKDIDIKFKTKEYVFKYDQAVTDKLESRVLDCRNFIKTLI